MRRKEKEIRDKSDMEEIIRKSAVCRLALSDQGRPYIVPLCFGYKDDTLFFHSATAGTKLDIIRKNNRVCFEFDVDVEVTRGRNACQWGMKFRSVIGYGKATMITDSGEKGRALDVLMEHYSGESVHAYSKEALDKAVIIRVDVDSMTGKKSGY